MAQVFGTDNDDESIYGTGSNDTILAGAGNDFIIGSTGSDLIDGGDGDSDVVFYSDLSAGVTVNNTDRQIGTLAAHHVLKAGGQIDSLTGVEAFHGSQFSDVFYMGDNTYVFAEGGNDRITVGNSVLVLPGSGNDTIYAGGDGSLDYLQGDGSALQTRGVIAVWTSRKDGIVSDDGWGNKDRFFGISAIFGSDFSDVLIGNVGDDGLGGGGGDDVLIGNDGNDNMQGGAGDDMLSGGAGDDYLSGGDGDDTLTGHDGGNGLDGGLGNDLYVVQSDLPADDRITDAGGDGDILQVLDTLERDAYRLVYDGQVLIHETQQGHRTEIALDEYGASVVEFLQWVGNPDYGTDFYENTLRIVTDLNNITGRLIAVAGTDGDDTIVMPHETPEDGEYWGEVYANGGNDTIYLSSTFEYITYGGDGDDSVYGQGDMADYVTGDGGNDYLDGAEGNDTLHGGAGEDSLIGGVGDDSLIGGGAEDGGEDFLSGGDGDDTLNAGDADGYLEGGAGNDLIIGGDGYDQISYEYSTGGVVVDLVTGLADDGMGGTDTLSGIEMLRGSAFGDVLTGDDQDNQFRGLAGNDTMDGGDGLDRVRYDKDEFRGATMGVVVDLGTGQASDGWGDVDTLINIEQVRGSIWDDLITGDGADNWLEGNLGNDTLSGGDGDDGFAGNEGDDHILGGSGSDWIQDGQGDDYYDGGDGYDGVEYVNALGAVQVDLETGLALDGRGGVDTLVNFERVTGSGFDDTLLGNDGETNSFTGHGGDDLIDGRGGWDHVWYGQSEAAVYVDLMLEGAWGGEGNDTLIGIEGLSGSNFADTLLGNDADNWFEPDIEGDIYTPNAFGGGNDHIDGRGGFDTVSYWRAISGISANLAFGTVTDGLGNTDRLMSIEGIEGSDYADSITGSGFADRLDGRSGDDTLIGRDGDDTLTGGDGDDLLRADGGTNIAEGGAGDDTYLFRYAGQTTVTDTEGDNWLRVEKTANGIFGGVYYDDDGSLVLLGTNGSSIRFATGSQLAGFTFVPLAREFSTYDITLADLAVGSLGDDTLYSSDSTYAEVYGADGNDLIFVQSTGASWVTGDGGDDEIHGGAGDDLVWGDLRDSQQGDDLIYGNDGADQIWGGKGNDQIFGGDGNDKIIGGDGDDVIDDGLGDDTVDGGAGTDTFQRYYEIDPAYSFTIGIDLAAGWIFSPQAPGAHPDLIRNIENVIVAGETQFILNGSGENNLLHSSDGDDTLNGVTGSDTLEGEAGNDFYITDGGDTIIEEAAEGIDTVQSSVTYTLGDNLENLTLSGSAAINGTGNLGDNLITGNAGANTLTGGGGNDTLIGGGGNDTFIIDAGDSVQEDLNGGVDQVQSSVSFTLGANVENLVLTGSAALDGTGNGLNNSLTGNNGANTLSAGDGIDRLVGGLGKDILTGGAGVDTFVFNAVAESDAVTANSDVITDFTRGVDKIDLRNIDAFAATGAVNDIFVWKGTGAFASGSQGEVRFQKFDNAGTANDYTMVLIDNDNDAAVEMAIRLTGVINLTATDFIL